MAATHKWIYHFREGSAKMRDLLGGKGAGAAEMTRAGMPVPPGFTITTEACRAYLANKGKFPPGMWEQATAALKTLERKTGKKLGDPKNPLLVSVRSGAKFSMPGMMDTVLNLGLNEETTKGLAALTSDERFALDARRRFIQMFGKTVMGIDGEKFEHALSEAKKRAGVKTDPELKPGDLRRLVASFLATYKDATGHEFPSDPVVQLRLAIEAVFKSWNTDRAKTYRRLERIPDDLGTAVNVQMMVFGNMGPTSGTGVAFTRNPITGKKELYGDYLPNAQGEDVVAGVRDTEPISALKRQLPKVYAEFDGYARKLEKHYKDVQDLEFTIERGKLYMLQTRSAKRTGEAAVRIAVDMVTERLITRREAVARVEPRQLEQLLFPRVDPAAKVHPLAKGERRARHGRSERHPHADWRHRQPRGTGRARHGQAVRGRRQLDRRRRPQAHVLGRRDDDQRGRGDHDRRHHRRGIRRQGAHHRGAVPQQAPRGERHPAVGRRVQAAPGVGERGLSARRDQGARERRTGGRAVPHGAHVHGAGSTPDRAGHDHGHDHGRAREGAGQALAHTARRLRGHLQTACPSSSVSSTPRCTSSCPAWRT